MGPKKGNSWKLLEQNALEEGRKPAKFRQRKEKKRAGTASGTSAKAQCAQIGRQKLPKKQATSRLEGPNKQDKLRRAKTKGSYVTVT